MALVPCQVLRVAILLSYFSILCAYNAIDMPAHQTYGGSWKFLTFIDLAPILRTLKCMHKCLHARCPSLLQFLFVYGPQYARNFPERYDYKFPAPKF
ncbi:androgen-induced gene 1 protein isoform 4-T5 [Macrochelys suwanniensis]